MYHVKYRNFWKKLVLMEGRTEFEDAKSEAEDCVHAGHREVEILVTADVNLDGAAAPSRRLPLPGCDDGTKTEAAALR